MAFSSLSPHLETISRRIPSARPTYQRDDGGRIRRTTLDRRDALKLSSTSQTQQQETDFTDEKGGCTVGDTRGAALLLEDITISLGINQIVRDVSWRVERGERWGIVGPNGCGKSTLLGSITGTVLTDTGCPTPLIAPKLNVGYLKQTAVSGSTKTVFEEACSEMKEIQSAKRDMERSENLIAAGDVSPEALNKLEDAMEAFTAAGGWTQEQTVGNVLKGLGFMAEDASRQCGEFSGGWQMRIALARLLLSEPSLLLLDEPSNHLDSSARAWLGSYLSNYDKGSLILVSHDVNLLQQSVDSIAEISSGTLLTYVSCTYDKYLEEKKFRAKSALAEYERNMAEAARLQAFVDRFGASATKAASAQSRVKMLEKMKKEGKLDPPPVSVVSEVFKPRLVLPSPPKSMGEILLEIKNGSLGYQEEDGETRVLLNNVNLEVTRNMKLLLRGPNGAGKSTLMKALWGELNLTHGERIENVQLRLGTFTQDLAQELPKSSIALDLVTDHARTGPHGTITVSNEQARNVMGQLGLTQDKALRKISELSGGEKARVALSMFALKPSNMLLLDEPSNHLDVQCIDALSEAIGGWEEGGAVVIVSHDREFCERVGFTHVGTVSDGRLLVEERGLRDSDWKNYDLQSQQTVQQNNNGAVNGVASTAAKDNRPLTSEEKELAAKRRKMKLNGPKLIAKLEKSIDKAEIKIHSLDEQMLESGTNLEKLVELTESKQKEEQAVADMMLEWEELEELLAEE